MEASRLRQILIRCPSGAFPVISAPPFKSKDSKSLNISGTSENSHQPHFKASSGGPLSNVLCAICACACGRISAPCCSIGKQPPLFWLQGSEGPEDSVPLGQEHIAWSALEFRWSYHTGPKGADAKQLWCENHTSLNANLSV